MADEPYTVRELDGKFLGVHEKLDAILKQTMATNGKVADIQKWRERVMGYATAVIVVGGAVIMPLLGWGLYRLANIDAITRSVVADELSTYQIEEIK